MTNFLQEISALVHLSNAGNLEAPPTNHGIALSIRDSILSGQLKLTGCMVLGVPIMPAGPLRPVSMPCCGFVVSYTGARQLVQKGRCQLCKKPIKEDALLEQSEHAVQTVLMEDRGFRPRLFHSTDVAFDDPPVSLGAGAEGSVVRGVLNGRHVAVKKMQLVGEFGPAEAEGFHQLICVSYIAGLSSRHVCKLLGYCSTDSELWCVTCLLACSKHSGPLSLAASKK